MPSKKKDLADPNAICGHTFLIYHERTRLIDDIIMTKNKEQAIENIVSSVVSNYKCEGLEFSIEWGKYVHSYISHVRTSLLDRFETEMVRIKPSPSPWSLLDTPTM